MNLKKIKYLILTMLFLIINYLLAYFLASIFNIEKTVFKSLTGMLPNIRGDIMIYIVLIFIEVSIFSKIQDKKNNN